MRTVIVEETLKDLITVGKEEAMINRKVVQSIEDHIMKEKKGNFKQTQ